MVCGVNRQKWYEMVYGVPEIYGASGNRGECSSERVCFRGNEIAGYIKNTFQTKHETKNKPLISLKIKHEKPKIWHKAVSNAVEKYCRKDPFPIPPFTASIFRSAVFMPIDFCLIFFGNVKAVYREAVNIVRIIFV